MKGRVKDQFTGVWLSPEQRRKLVALSQRSPRPGNLSTTLRWMIDNVKLTGSGAEISVEDAQTAKGQST